MTLHKAGISIHNLHAEQIIIQSSFSFRLLFIDMIYCYYIVITVVLIELGGGQRPSLEERESDRRKSPFAIAADL
jgi:hypothetical protein